MYIVYISNSNVIVTNGVLVYGKLVVHYMVTSTITNNKLSLK